jgi:hypothetical protein
VLRNDILMLQQYTNEYALAHLSFSRGQMNQIINSQFRSKMLHTIRVDIKMVCPYHTNPTPGSKCGTTWCITFNSNTKDKIFVSTHFLSTQHLPHSPKRMHPGSARLPTAFFSIISKNSSIRSSLISASTTIQIGMARRDEDVKDRAGFRECWGANA